MNFSACIYRWLEVPVFVLPAWLVRWRVLDPMARATRGSVDAACIARKKGWAINLSGGYHHASRSRGGGFCVYPDITFVTHYMEKWHGVKRFMIIDLDAHQGDGHGRDHTDKARFHIFDAYNHDIYPGDMQARRNISTDINFVDVNQDDIFLPLLEEKLNKAFMDFSPDFVIYNAGTDCMAGDPLGQLNISEMGIIKRDEIVFRLSYEVWRVPIVMLMSGGYQMTNAPVIAASI
eukprot:CAMPEP_0176369562 /NCGR_PEP_ID=MMETSP0126-20121128/23375_1 /TAXON_ID=141414 ORGANISM="Strombidinopsis acuminatum, Strain SPMC142" /NCGR_SAMPLE_ID=MMETSP0126 /ASSEMBLY_ACC=CAM_ASM_000229 /LENGTH=233 /DNA_ID=CAMNT_0017728249 /DNA_START=445 /DNA_END=1146 /DNA_ORIENTATION=-